MFAIRFQKNPEVLPNGINWKKDNNGCLAAIVTNKQNFLLDYLFPEYLVLSVGENTKAFNDQKMLIENMSSF